MSEQQMCFCGERGSRASVAPDAAPVIEVCDLSFAYEDHEVLSHINLTVRAGEFMAIIGPNGGGKTTLVKLLLGLLSPTRGRVRVLGVDPARIAPAVGYVPQQARMRPGFPITVLEATLQGLRRPHGMLVLGRWPGYPAKDKEKARAALALVGMADFADRHFDALSGGQKQRVLVARALVSDPALLLFDEPTSSIDPQGKVCLFDLISELSDSITVIMVSHELLSASSRITSVTAVNRLLIQNTGRELTPQMLELIYGIHTESCPLEAYIRGVSAFLTSQEKV